MLLRHDGRSLVVYAPAKINLFLEILSKRSDGYHELVTLMVSVGIYDTLSFREEDSTRIRLRAFDASSCRPTGLVSLSGVSAGRNNLVLRSAELLRSHVGVKRGVCVDLYKRIPVAAGLGGGSSDAAATLVALNRLWDLRLNVGELTELASQLGSDVGFFLSGASAAVCRGRGEIVEPLSLPDGLHFVIARPRSGLSTATVYENCRPSPRRHDVDDLVDSLRRGQLARAADRLHNSLQATAEKLNPHVKQIRERFSGQSLLSHMMSGSGTAYFGIGTSRRQVLRVAGRLRAANIGWVDVAQSGP